MQRHAGHKAQVAVGCNIPKTPELWLQVPHSARAPPSTSQLSQRKVSKLLRACNLHINEWQLKDFLLITPNNMKISILSIYHGLIRFSKGAQATSSFDNQCRMSQRPVIATQHVSNFLLQGHKQKNRRKDLQTIYLIQQDVTNSHNSIIKKQVIQFLKRAKDLNRQFSKKRYTSSQYAWKDAQHH